MAKTTHPAPSPNFPGKYGTPPKRHSKKHRGHLVQIHAHRQARHVHHIRTFAKTLHGLGVDVEEDIKQIKWDQGELEEAILKLGEVDFLKGSDKRKLKSQFQKLRTTIGYIIGFEQRLWQQFELTDHRGKKKKTSIKALTHEANHRSLRLPSARELRASRALGSARHAAKLAHVLAEIRQISDTLLCSLAKEPKNGPKIYNKLLGTVEGITRDFAELEKKWGKGGGIQRGILTEVHHDFEKVVHEDLNEISQDLIYLYDLRIATYDRLIALNEAAKAAVPLRQERQLMIGLREKYFSAYQKHSEAIVKIYGGAP